jgi:hypothetical protein
VVGGGGALGAAVEDIRDGEGMAIGDGGRDGRRGRRKQLGSSRLWIPVGGGVADLVRWQGANSGRRTGEVRVGLDRLIYISACAIFYVWQRI